MTTALEFENWMAGHFAATPEPTEKIMLCGPKFYWFLTGEFDPARHYKLRGNAHQRRILRRYRARMWKILGAFDWAGIKAGKKSAPPSKIVVA